MSIEEFRCQLLNSIIWLRHLVGANARQSHECLIDSKSTDVSEVQLLRKHCSPKQRAQFIGAIIDSITAKAFLPQSIWALIRKVCCSSRSKAIMIQRLLGHKSAAISIPPHAKLHMRLLQLSFLKQFCVRSYFLSKIFHLSSSVKNSLTWWSSATNIFQGPLFHIQTRCSLQMLLLRVEVLTCQTSALGTVVPRQRITAHQSFGTEGDPLCYPFLSTTPCWPSCSNSFGQHYGNQLYKPTRGHRVQIFLQVRSQKLDSLYCQLYPFVGDACPRDRKGHSRFTHRRTSAIHEWELNSNFFPPVFQAWDFPRNRCLCHQTQCEMWQILHKRGRDPLSKGDRLLLDWSGWFLYIFPPLPLLLRVIMKLQYQPA